MCEFCEDVYALYMEKGTCIGERVSMDFVALGDREQIAALGNERVKRVVRNITMSSTKLMSIC